MPAYGKVKVDTITYDLSGTATDVSVANIATKASPTFTGTVTVPTPSAGDNSTKAASTAYVQTELGDYLTTSTAASTYAPLASPTFTGSPTVPGYAALSGATFTGTVNGTSLVLSADLTVNGTTTTINTTTLQVEDKNIEIGKVSSPSDTTADGGGWTLKGATDKTFNWVNATDAWTSSEHIHLGDDKKLLIGTGSDLELFHNATNSHIRNQTGDLIIDSNSAGSVKLRAKIGEEGVVVITDGAVEIYHDGSKKFATASFGVQFEEDVQFPSAGDNNALTWDKSEHTLEWRDNVKAAWGDGDDLQIYHDGTQSLIEGTAPLYIKGSSVIIYKGGTTEKMLQCNGDGETSLWHDNVKRVATTSSGINVTGAIQVNGSALSTAPQITATADGAITAGKPVIVTTAGKVKQVQESATAAQPTLEAKVDLSNGNSDLQPGVFVYDPDAGKLVYFYARAYANDNCKYGVFTVSASNPDPTIPSFAVLDQSVDTSIKAYPGEFEWGDACYDTNNNKYIWGCRNGNNDDVVVKTGSYSNNSITWDSSTTNPIGSGGNGRAVRLYFDKTTNRIVCIYRNTDQSGYPYVNIGTYNTSSNSIDWGTQQQLHNGNISDANTYICKAGAGTGQVMVGYNVGSSCRANLITVSNSSNTCTIQSSAEIFAGGVSTRVAYNEEDQNIIFGYRDANTSATAGTLRRLTINSGATGFDASSTLVFMPNSNASCFDFVYSFAAKQVFVVYRTSVSDTKSYVFRITNTSGTPTKGDDVSAGTTWGTQGDNLYSKGSSGIETNTVTSKIFFGQALSNGNRTIGTVETATSSTNLTTENYIGTSKAAYNDAATATINVSGSLDENQSSLTAGQKYFVQNDGSLGLTAATPKVFAGTAVSATKLIVNDQAPPISSPIEILGSIELGANHGSDNFSFTGLTTGTYMRYQLIISQLQFVGSGAKRLGLQMYNGSGNLLSTNGTYTWRTHFGASAGNGSGSDSEWQFLNNEDRNFWDCEIMWHDRPNASSGVGKIMMRGNFMGGGLVSWDEYVECSGLTNTDFISGVKIFNTQDGTNLAYGRATLYGYRYV